jgi:hypothetical protein
MSDEVLVCHRCGRTVDLSAESCAHCGVRLVRVSPHGWLRKVLVPLGSAIRGAGEPLGAHPDQIVHMYRHAPTNHS